ncbi:TPA_asm: hypothetical protein GBZ56_02360 [Salmonella enterica subsp. enterica serovar Agona]|uniref:Uncharacterized protein n=2 Tax=Gammaproteobacteria TaxID=1236 RepID=A0A6Y2Z7B7_SALET|nr:hypothetical protein EGV95_17380 [Pseudomonas aeruginosa]EBB7772628.1 hypothetical protein [Salmonella enterica subsp. enterica serovar Tennessee]EBF7169107.1 hypothetical protein [Salmonella enterica]MBA0288648.1 hypothetical protein [Stenotrophomonas maltophilia]MBK80371.1 hypothetical protein [Gammaproteobacteria bacterium]MRT60798.1 hypothetical protein [Pseudomonas sp. CAH-1]RCF49337.1 hypothetical protein C6C11_11255 [Aeromonas hydrophila]RIJ70440.1 hypothetical protein D1505_25290 
MDSLVLSGNRRLVLSGNTSSCYQAQKSAENPRHCWLCAPSNIPNKKYITFSRSAPLRWTTAKRHHAQQPKPGFPTRRAAP